MYIGFVSFSYFFLARGRPTTYGVQFYWDEEIQGTCLPAQFFFFGGGSLTDTHPPNRLLFPLVFLGPLKGLKKVAFNNKQKTKKEQNKNKTNNKKTQTQNKPQQRKKQFKEKQQHTKRSGASPGLISVYCYFRLLLLFWVA